MVGRTMFGVGFARRLSLLTFVALVVRLAWILLEPGNRIVADEGAWLAWGQDVLRAQGVRFSPFRARMIFHPPVYPYFIGVITELVGGLGAVKGAQAVVGALLVPAVGLIGRRAFGERAGFLAACVVSFYPELIWFSAHFWADAALLDPERDRSTWRGVGLGLAAGLLLAAAILTRETVLYFVPFMALGLLWRRDPRRLAAAGGFILVTLLVVALWTWRNHVVFGSFVPVSTSGGLNLFQGNARLTRQEVYNEYHAIRGRIAKYEFARRKGIEAIVARQPWWIFEKLREEMPNFWEADSQALVHVRRGAYGEARLGYAAAATAVLILPFLLLLALFPLGVGGLPRGPVPWFLLGFLVYYMLLHVATHGYARYRIPALPVLFLVAASALASFGEWRFRDLTRQRRLAVAATAIILFASVLPSLRYLVRAQTLVSENARFGLDPDGQPLDGGEP
jgi:4-amino-4-deoxy-L-arabinose transferase-like glycosyltransferase